MADDFDTPLDDFEDDRIRPHRSLRDLTPISLGEIKVPFSGEEDRLDEMLDG